MSEAFGKVATLSTWRLPPQEINQQSEGKERKIAVHYGMSEHQVEDFATQKDKKWHGAYSSPPAPSYGTSALFPKPTILKVISPSFTVFAFSVV
jgi:hypothetical protein